VSKYVNFDELVGKVLVRFEGGVGSDEIFFHCDDGAKYRMSHIQD